MKLKLKSSISGGNKQKHLKTERRDERERKGVLGGC